MGIADAAKDKAEAKVSELQARIAALKADLSGAQAELSAAQATDSVVDKVTSPEFLQDVSQPLRDKSDASVAAAKSRVAQVQSDLSIAETKLAAYQAAQSAIDSVVDPQ